MQGTVADVQGLGQNPPQQVDRLLQPPRHPARSNAPIADLVPQLGHDAVRRPRPHRDAGRDRLGRDRPGVRRRRAGRLLRAPAGHDRSQPNEIKQLLTMTAEDVVRREHRRHSARPIPAQSGWDQHFGYGKPDLGLAMERIAPGQDPAAGADHLAGVVRAAERRASRRRRHRTRRVSANAPAATPTSSSGRRASSRPRATSSDVTSQPARRRIDGSLGMIDLDARSAPRSTRAPAAARPTTRPRPRKGPGDKDPNEPAFTVRVIVTDAAGNRGEDRKVLFDYRDTTLHQGCPQDIGTRRRGVPAAVRPERRQQARHGAGRLERRAAGAATPTARRCASFNGGQPRADAALPERAPRRCRLQRASSRRARCCARPRSATSTATWSPRSSTPRASTSTPGTPTARPCRASRCALDPAFSRPQDRTRDNHIKRGFIRLAHARRPERRRPPRHRRSPALDQHVYAWDGSGNPMPGFPRSCSDPSVPGAEIINTRRSATSPATAGRTSSRPTAEFDDNPSAPPRRAAAPRRLRELPHQRPRQRARRQRPRVRARPQRQRAARLADEAERHRARRTAVRRPGRGPRARRTSTATRSSR